MTKATTNNIKRVPNTIVEQIMHIAGSNNTNTYKLLTVSCFCNRQALHVN